MTRATFVPHLVSLLIPGLNVEPLVDTNLLIGGGVKISVCIYAAARAVSQVAHIDDYRKLTGAITTFCVVLSLWEYENQIEMSQLGRKGMAVLFNSLSDYYSAANVAVIPQIGKKKSTAS